MFPKLVENIEMLIYTLSYRWPSDRKVDFLVFVGSYRNMQLESSTKKFLQN